MSRRSVGMKRQGSFRRNSDGPPRKRALFSPEELSRRAREEVKPSIWSLVGYEPSYTDAAELLAKAAQRYKDSQQWDKAADTFIEAAETFNRANEEEKAITQRENAARTYYDSVCGVLTVEATLDRREDALALAIKQLNIALLYYQEHGKYNEALKTADDIAAYHLVMDQYGHAAVCYFDAGKNCSTNDLDTINRCLLYCTACRILDGSDHDARQSYLQIRANLEEPYNKKGATKIQWSEECWIIYALCCIQLNMEVLVSTAHLCRQACEDWDDLLSMLSDRNGKIRFKSLTNLKAYIERKDQDVRESLFSTDDAIASPLMKKVISFFDSLPHPTEAGYLLLEEQHGNFKLKYILNEAE